MTYAEFPFTPVGNGYFGPIKRPYAHVELSSHKIDDWVPAEAVVDTGADYTLLPRRYSDLLGIDVNVDCCPDTTLGVGGSETIYLCKDLVRLRIGKWESAIPAGFLERNDVPLLLGRQGNLELFHLIFNQHVTRFDKSD